jgi:hypothetical protein
MRKDGRAHECLTVSSTFVNEAEGERKSNSEAVLPSPAYPPMRKQPPLPSEWPRKDNRMQLVCPDCSYRLNRNYGAALSGCVCLEAALNVRLLVVSWFVRV